MRRRRVVPSWDPTVPEDPDRAGPEREACRRCGLWEASRHPRILAEVPDGWDHRVLVVGEKPGEVEDREGRPFVGPSGRLLRSLVEAEGLAGSVAYANAVKCRGPSNATPTMDQIRACRPFLLWELRTLGPKAVVALGATAAASLRLRGNERAVTRLRRRALWLDLPDDACGPVSCS